MRNIIFIIFAVIFLSSCKKKDKEITPVIVSDCKYFIEVNASDREEIKKETCKGYGVATSYRSNNPDHIVIAVFFDKNDKENVIEIDSKTAMERTKYIPKHGDWLYQYDGIEFISNSYSSFITIKEHKVKDFAKGRYYFEGFNGSKMITIKGGFYIDLSNEN